MIKKSVAIISYIIILFVVVTSFFLFSFLSKTLPNYVDDKYEFKISESSENSSSEYEGIIYPWSFYEESGDILSGEDGALEIEKIIYDTIITANPEKSSSMFRCNDVMSFDELHRFVFVKDYIYQGDNGNCYCLNASYDISLGQLIFLKSDLYNESREFDRDRIISATKDLKIMLSDKNFFGSENGYSLLLGDHKSSFEQYLSDIIPYISIPNNLSNNVKLCLKDNCILTIWNGIDGNLGLFYSPEEEKFTGYCIENK